VDPVSDGLRGTRRVDGRRPLPVADVQLLGILTTQRLWKLRLQPIIINTKVVVHKFSLQILPKK
jgi:hypothetical protein